VRKWICLALFLFIGRLVAQTSAPSLATYPDILTPQAAANVALAQYKSVLEGNIATTFQLEQNDAQSIALLQSQISSQASQISALQAAVIALQNVSPPAPAGTTLNFASLGDGPLNGIYKTVDFGTGFWTVIGGELAPLANGQPQRGMIFQNPVTILSLTFSVASTTVSGIVATSSTGQTASSTAVGVNQDTTFTPGWATPTKSITFTANTGGDATMLRIRSLTYK
jgi:hypothetical protein